MYNKDGVQAAFAATAFPIAPEEVELMKKGRGEGLVRFVLFFEETRAFIAVRQGLTMMIPLITLGAFALMLKTLPIAPYQALLETPAGLRFVELLNFIYGGTFQIFSVALAVTTSVSYAMLKNADSRSERAALNDCFILATLTLISLMGYVGIQNEDFSISSLGTVNTFMALLIALCTGLLYFRVRDAKIFSRMRSPETDMDGLYYIAVSSILPAAVVVFIFAALHQLFILIFHVSSLQEGLIIFVEDVLALIKGNFSTGLSILISTHFMWLFGIHGNNVLEGVVQKNFAAVDGVTIYSKTFQDVFTIMGGCGAALGLTLAILLLSRKKVLKNVARLALPSVLFNISEVIIFGLPIVFNPIFFLPFMLAPVVNFVVSYGAMYFGVVPIVAHQVEWTTPIFLSGWEATGSVSGGILQLICLGLDMLIYLPFIRLFEEYSDRSMGRKVDKLVELLRNEEATNIGFSLTGREDTLGAVARSLASDLDGAIDRGELYLLFQPQVNSEGKCLGAEALLRWQHPIVGFIYPPLIIRLAKERGILSKLDTLVFDSAAKALAVIEKEYADSFKLSVNITNESLLWDGFENMVDETVSRYGVSRDKLWMELTEQDALSNAMDVKDCLSSLRAKGHRFLIDDFGMGHASLLYLQTGSFSVVKLDGSITSDVITNSRSRDVLRSIVQLGELLNFSTVAEVVETKEQKEALQSLGVTVFQGFYFSKPIPLDELLNWLKAH